MGEQRGSQQSPADAAPAAPAAARPGTEAAAAAAARPTWLQRDGTAARLLHVGDGAVWMQSTSRPPPGRQSGGLGGQSSLSLQQRLTDTAAYGRPARSQQSAPRGAASPSFLPPPATPPRRAAGPQSGVHGWCVCVCVCGTCVAVQGGGGMHGAGHARLCVCKLCQHARARPHTQPSSAACSSADLSRLQGEGRCTHVCTHTHTKTPPHTPPQPHSPPLCAQTGPKIHFQGWKHWRLVGGGTR